MLNRALRYLREAESLSLTETATKLGMSKAYVSEIENGKKTPSIETIQRYSDYFDIPPSHILFFAEEIQNNEGKFSHKARLFLSEKILSFAEKYLH